MADKALKIVNGVPRMTSVGVEVRDEGVVVQSTSSYLNFTGATITAEDSGSGGVNISSGPFVNIYDEKISIPSGGYAINDVINLPNSGEYDSVDLKVFLEGIFLEESIDYEYVGVAPRTSIKILRNGFEEGLRLRFIVSGNAGSIYDEIISIGAGGLAASSLITLPNSGTYADSDLKVYLDGVFLEVLIDYNYYGDPNGNRTQIQSIVEFFEGERLRFRKE